MLGPNQNCDESNRRERRLGDTTRWGVVHQLKPRRPRMRVRKRPKGPSTDASTPSFLTYLSPLKLTVSAMHMVSGPDRTPPDHRSDVSKSKDRGLNSSTLRRRPSKEPPKAPTVPHGYVLWWLLIIILGHLAPRLAASGHLMVSFETPIALPLRQPTSNPDGHRSDCELPCHDVGEPQRAQVRTSCVDKKDLPHARECAGADPNEKQLPR